MLFSLIDSILCILSCILSEKILKSQIWYINRLPTEKNIYIFNILILNDIIWLIFL